MKKENAKFTFRALVNATDEIVMLDIFAKSRQKGFNILVKTKKNHTIFWL